MLFQEISRFLGRYLFYFTLILCLPLSIAIFYQFFGDPLSHPQPHGSLAFAKTIGISLLLSICFLYFGKKASGNFQRRESILIVALVWFLTPFISSLPFLFTHTFDHPIDAYFEAMSGLTTTGSSVIYPKVYDSQSGIEILSHAHSTTDPNISYHFYGTVAPVRDPHTGQILHLGIEAVGKALLFWRSFLQWIGGMGIIVLFITILPALSMGGRFLFEAEVPGPTKDSMTPRIKETASLLWRIYLGLTVLQIFLLMITNASMPFFDAVTLSLSTISTGGFTIRNDGLAAYHSLSTDWIIVLFMILGSLNFTLYFHCIRGKIYRIYEPEFFSFLLSLALGSLLMGVLLFATPKILHASNGIFSLTDALRYGTFQAISAQTSTGFAFASYNLWPQSTQILLLILMFFGGMSGSTAGGIKMIRHLILFRVMRHKIESIFRPDAVRCLKIGQREIADKIAITVFVFFAILITFTVLGTFLLVIDGIDLHTAMGLITSMINNGGLFLTNAGTMESCAFLSSFSKIISIIWMALGRLEFFILLVLLVPAFWKGK